MTIEITNADCPLYPFLHAARGNWRNSIFIACDSCPYGKPSCGGFLMAMDAEGRPILLSTEEFTQVTGQAVDKEECVSVLHRTDFEALYAIWLEWQVAAPLECAVTQLIQNS